MTPPQYDIILFGATSFVGKLTTRYLYELYGVNGKGGSNQKEQLNWAIAARSETKLNELCESLGYRATRLPKLIVNADNIEQLRDMCRQTRLVISTVGPYALYGELLIRACVENGTDYCDLTGEVQWVHRMIDSFQQQAETTGARIVNCCGFDCVPSDMGVYYLQQQAKQHFGKYCKQVSMRVKTLKGGLSGGTLASLFNIVKEAAHDPKLRQELADPYSLCPGDFPKTTRQHPIGFARYDSNYHCWLAPFVMAPVNERIVLRSNALAAQMPESAATHFYGSDFQYDEAILTTDGIGGRCIATGASVFTFLFTLGAAIAPTRWALEKLLPAPGTGPSEEVQENGFYDLRFIGRTDEGETIQVKVTGDKDPGYAGTAKILGQTAVCLAKDINKAEKSGGFWTTASLFDERLLARLQNHAGMIFEPVP